MSRCLVLLLWSVMSFAYAGDLGPWEKRDCCGGDVELQGERVYGDEEVYWVSEEEGAGASFATPSGYGYSVQEVEQRQGENRNRAPRWEAAYVVSSGNCDQDDRFSGNFFKRASYSLNHNFNPKVSGLQKGSKEPVNFTIYAVKNECGGLITLHRPGSNPLKIKQEGCEELRIEIPAEGFQRGMVSIATSLYDLSFFVETNRMSNRHGALCAEVCSRSQEHTENWLVIDAVDGLHQSVGLEIGEEGIEAVPPGKLKRYLQKRGGDEPNVCDEGKVNSFGAKEAGDVLSSKGSLKSEKERELLRSLQVLDDSPELKVSEGDMKKVSVRALACDAQKSDEGTVVKSDELHSFSPLRLIAALFARCV